MLDDLDSVHRIDKNDMYSLMIEFPRDLKRAFEEASRVDIPDEVKVADKTIRYQEPKEVIVCGMGGSSIGGEIVRDYVWDKIKISYRVVRGYHLPASVDSCSLVFVVSYSGNTEETLSCLREAIEREAMVVGITSNGEMERILTKVNAPLFKVKKGYPPRAAVAFLTAPIFTVLEKMNLIKIDSSELEETFNILSKLREKLDVSSPLGENPAKRLALGLYGTLPFVYSYTPYSSIGLRFKTQLNENCKIHAKFEELPELDHNEIMGWYDVTIPNHFLSVVFLRGPEEEDTIRARVEFLYDILVKKKIRVFNVVAEGTTRLASMFSLLYICDMATFYLAILRGIDPLPVQLISELKKFLEIKVAFKARLITQLDKLITS
ncbi:MAG: bifunctional phosphoglucose/phosphomannose isomerase [Thermoprotei archaeon]|nr:MAG: bifunctional phosphoglucose/phosphomannose isomerase [Thermoprotei archaeon]